jgi:hypothetical protein
MANGADNPSPPSMIEKIRGKRTRDIRLPMPAGGTRDPRLGRPSTKAQMVEGVDRYQDIMRTMKGRKRQPAKRAATRR